MNFSKLSKEKKNHLLLVGLVTLMLMVGIGYGLIRFQLDYVKALQAQKVEADKSFKKMMSVIGAREDVQKRLDEAINSLSQQENAMVTGDKLSWLIRTIEQSLRQHPKLQVPDFSTITEEDCTLLARFPYSQVTIGIKGTGRYHDLGRFLADFENSHPHFRIVNLELEPAAPGPRDEKEVKEQLSFKLTVIALVKPA
jgi:Tfp pilus assembly protein PilO